jgi:chromatin remodeling complex protein RSC6
LEGLGARKEEIVEEEVQTVARAGVEEAELSDEELLGEATLAKLVTHPKDIAEGEIKEIAEELEEEKGDEFELAEEEVSELIGEEEGEKPATEGDVSDAAGKPEDIKESEVAADVSHKTVETDGATKTKRKTKKRE